MNGFVLDTYWPRVPVLFSRHNWLKTHYDNRTELFCKTDSHGIIKWHQFFEMTVAYLWWQIKQALHLEIYSTDSMIKGDGRRDRMVVGFTAISCTIHGKIACIEQVNFQWNDDEVHFVLMHYAQLDLYSANSMKQQSMDRHVALLGHIILIPNQSVFVLFP